MKFRHWTIWSLCFMLLIVAVPAYAADTEGTSFDLSVKQDGEQVVIVVQANKLKDMYAFDLALEADAGQLKLVSAKSEMSGFTVDPIVKGNTINFAFTKVGKSLGIDGDTKLVTFTFKSLHNKQTIVKLNQVQLVNSNLEKVIYKPALQVMVNGSSMFGDIAGHWAEKAILQAVEQGFVTGYANGMFRPQGEVTRGEFITMLVRALKLPELSTAKPIFADHDEIPGWAQPYIAVAVQSKLISGYDDQTFRASQQISRAEIAAVMVRVLDENRVEEAKLNFADAALIPEWAKPSVATAVDTGLMKGKGNNRFAPMELATRAEAVVVIQNLLQIEKETK